MEKGIDSNEEVCYTYDEKGISYLNEKAINGLNLYAYCENNPVRRIDPNAIDAILITAYQFGNGWFGG